MFIRHVTQVAKKWTHSNRRLLPRDIIFYDSSEYIQLTQGHQEKQDMLFASLLKMAIVHFQW